MLHKIVTFTGKLSANIEWLSYIYHCRPTCVRTLERNHSVAPGLSVAGSFPGQMSWPGIRGNMQGWNLFSVTFVIELSLGQTIWECMLRGTKLEVYSQEAISEIIVSESGKHLLISMYIVYIIKCLETCCKNLIYTTLK